MTDAKALPLDQWHRGNGARMVPFAGYEMPIQYEGIMAEHLWTRESAGLFDVSHMGQVELWGEGAAEALEAIVPGDISALKPGRIRYTLLLNEGGGIVDDLMVTNAGDHLYLVVNGATKAGDLDFLRTHLPDDIEIRHLEDQALLALQGPKAAETLARLDITAMWGDGSTPGDLYFMQGGGFEWEGVTIGVSRSGYTGEDGFEITVPGDAVEKLATALLEQPEVKPIGLGARDSLRLEAGLPLYGHDIDEDTTPIAADLGFAISKKRREDGDFHGAERILQERESGSIAKRVGLVIEGRQPVREGAPVLNANGDAVGKVTSGGFAPSLQKPIAMAYVPTASAEPGTEITVEQRGKLFTGIVTPMPFVPHHYHRPPKA